MDNYLLKNARELRKNMTKQERHLWYDFLRYYPIKFYKQRIIDNYIADFYCASAKLVIELDGSQHYTQKGQKNDEIRTIALNKHNLKVIRFSNLDIDRNFRGVCEYIDLVIKRRTSQPPYGDSSP
ncbi:MAG: endonuclease domain-containing protein [Clostridia bacterium]